ncbi:MAG: YhbY family RNA-binding protein [Steroidobacteraceae bacterium]|jgi:RNA-binding protein|nr:YhbY family RNA-binding protein [Steroidobacteraceae bacterium]
MQLTEKQKKHLRKLGHPLNPVVMLGNAGLTDAVVAELDRALTDHELVKVRARVGERDARDEALGTLATRTGSQLVQRIGNVGLFFRPRPKVSRIVLPDG